MDVRRPVELSDSPIPGWRLWLLVAFLFCLILFSGCHAFRPQDRQAFSISSTGPLVEASVPVSLMVAAESHLVAAKEMEAQGSDVCVDHYYRAALLAWQSVESASVEYGADAEGQAAWQIYQESLSGLIAAGHEFGRLDSRRSLKVVGPRGQQVIPIAYHGFAWQPGDFTQVLLAQEYQGSKLAHHYQTPGLGTSLVALRQASHEEPFYQPQVPFAVTAVLRPRESAGQQWQSGVGDASGSEAVLEFYNPRLFDSMPVGARTVSLHRDLTAPLVYVERQSSRNYLEGFFDPGETDVRPKLLMMEPYQRGKIPVVFIHGLLSDPTTWLDAANELRAQPELSQRYQFWYYRYPTGGALLDSAATLREQLLTARETFDPAGQDPALCRIVLVGHSMGGLIARLQVTYSYDILWRHGARQPLEAVRTTPELRNRLERVYFFDPSPLVQRVVFVGTPHRGSNMARRLVGRVASSLVSPFVMDKPDYRQLMDDNEDIFYEYLQRSPPTSIDLLEPSNPLLDALASMPFRRCVRLHTVLGTGESILDEPSDGVVPVSSSHLDGVCSELEVPVRHQQLQHDPATLAELSRILREHAGEPLR